MFAHKKFSFAHPPKKKYGQKKNFHQHPHENILSIWRWEMIVHRLPTFAQQNFFFSNTPKKSYEQMKKFVFINPHVLKIVLLTMQSFSLDVAEVCPSLNFVCPPSRIE